MGFSDVLKKSFVQATTESMSRGDAIAALAAACLIAVYIFFIYRVITRKAFYNKNFNISLVALALITTAIILSIQSSVVISLGMVGASAASSPLGEAAPPTQTPAPGQTAPPSKRHGPARIESAPGHTGPDGRTR